MANILKIGTSYGGLATFASLGISTPIAHPVVPYSDLSQMASGSVVARGFAVSKLLWPGQLSTAERAILRGLIPGASAALYVQVPNELYSDTIYTCIALWPKRTPDNSQAPKFDLELIKLLVATS
jgi:hypothetical protein